MQDATGWAILNEAKGSDGKNEFGIPGDLAENVTKTYWWNNDVVAHILSYRTLSGTWCLHFLVLSAFLYDEFLLVIRESGEGSTASPISKFGLSFGNLSAL